MTGGKILGFVAALLLLLAGGWLALTGMGYLGSGATSTAWSILGAALAGFGVALLISLVRPNR